MPNVLFFSLVGSNQMVSPLISWRKRILSSGESALIFPEGTRSRTGELQPFKKGAFVLAIQTGADVVPALIEGSFEVMQKGSWRIRAGTVDIYLGEPIRVDRFSVDQRDELTSLARARLEGLRAPLEPHGN